MFTNKTLKSVSLGKYFLANYLDVQIEAVIIGNSLFVIQADWNILSCVWDDKID